MTTYELVNFPLYLKAMLGSFRYFLIQTKEDNLSLPVKTNT